MLVAERDVHISIARTYTEESVAEKASKISILVLHVYSVEDDYSRRITPSSPAMRDNSASRRRRVALAALHGDGKHDTRDLEKILKTVFMRKRRLFVWLYIVYPCLHTHHKHKPRLEHPAPRTAISLSASIPLLIIRYVACAMIYDRPNLCCFISRLCEFGRNHHWVVLPNIRTGFDPEMLKRCFAGFRRSLLCRGHHLRRSNVAEPPRSSISV
ncbi:hypothetical protein ARMGADRAFT_823325 [Armillaria gallica]|uniref:Uncharacterized protein n=1 Tax=Armillaria gallica TaxID=47427 RepID=A0A2H3CHF9_ARMGA|nr:hypothetical protein ARMGADRAFT_823325 [Armillaria gallica]